MGWLFEDRSAKNPVKQEIATKLQKLDLLDQILQDWVVTAGAEGFEWMTSCTGHHDSLERTVVFTTENIHVINCKRTEISNLSALLRRAENAVIWAFSDKASERAAERLNEAKAESAKFSTNDSCSFNYTYYGYTPLPDHGYTPRAQVLEVWATYAALQIKEKFSGIAVEETPFDIGNDVFGATAFAITYRVPARPWKSWF